MVALVHLCWKGSSKFESKAWYVMRKRSEPKTNRVARRRSSGTSNGDAHTKSDSQISRLAQAFGRIGSPRLRAKILLLVEALGARK